MAIDTKVSPEKVTTEPEIRKDPVPVRVVENPMPLLKGQTVQVCYTWTFNGTLDTIVNVENFNRILVEVLVSGTTPSVTIRIQSLVDGTQEITLPDSNATRTGVTATTSYVVDTGCRFLKVNLSSISGTFGAGQGYTIWVTPYVS